MLNACIIWAGNFVLVACITWAGNLVINACIIWAGNFVFDVRIVCFMRALFGQATLRHKVACPNNARI